MGAVKIHVGQNHSGYLPEFVTVTEGKTHDVTVAHTLKFPKGSIVAVDKGYNDYAWYNHKTKWDYFITRLQTNEKYSTVSRRSVIKARG